MIGAMAKRKRKRPEVKAPRRLRSMQLEPPVDNPSPAQQKRELKAVLQASVENIAIDVEEWIRSGARENPLGAVSAFASLAEFVAPKLARTEQINTPGKMTKEDVEAQLRELGLDPDQVWEKLG